MPAPATGSATVVYPANWHTVTAPPTAACRYFDPAAITVPADPSTLTTAVMIKSDPAATYDAALAAATNPTAWNVLTNKPVTVSGLPATQIEATSTAGSPGVPAGSTRYGYLINVRASGLDRDGRDRRQRDVHLEQVGGGPDGGGVDDQRRARPSVRRSLRRRALGGLRCGSSRAQSAG